MSEQESWAERMRGIDPDDFTAAKDAAAEIPLTLLALASLFRQNQTLQEKRQALAGETGSKGSLFAMADFMEPAMVGPKEAEWFRQAATFCRQVMNAIAEKPLGDTGDFTEEELHRAVLGPYARQFNDLRRKVEKIDSVFPPQERGQAV